MSRSIIGEIFGLNEPEGDRTRFAEHVAGQLGCTPEEARDLLERANANVEGAIARATAMFSDSNVVPFRLRVFFNGCTEQ